MRRVGALLLLAVAALLVTPGAPGEPDVSGDPTPPVVTPIITGTLGSEGWYTSNVTVNWAVSDPESIILTTSGCDARTLTADTIGTKLTCAAESDGGETIISKTLKLDKTAPAASASPSRGADSNGWYNHALSVDFTAGDATSGVASCSAPRTYSGPDSLGTPVSGSCVDHAGNTAQASFPLKYDATAPQASPAARQPDANGWYNHAVTVSFQGADGTSGIASCTQQTYAGPDDPSVALTGTCVDRAGNASSSSQFTLRYDETPPKATATASRGPDANGWYNHSLTVTFAGSDALSGLASCDAPKTYSGPDAASVSVEGSCRDNAGNAAPRSILVKYDATPPTATASARAPDANGWYNAPLTVSFAGSDATSGPVSCDPAKTYSSPDSKGTSLGGSCRDQAGNLGSTSFGLKYDATPPTATASARAPDANGWYNAPLTVSFTGSDATSGLVSCDAAKSYSSPDSKGTSLGGTCRDQAGNAGSTTFGFKYDATAPQVTSAVPTRTPDRAGWYNRPVVVVAQGTDSTSGLASCPGVTYAGPDGDDAPVAGTCLDLAGNVGRKGFTIDYDATGPQAAALPSRGPDANGWYNHALTVSYAGTDRVAGLDSCAAAESYDGPDSGSAVLTGICLDKAGNASIAAYPLAYDATAPQVTGVTPARAPDAAGWYNRALSVSFHGSDDTSGVEACTQTTYAGPDSAGASVSGSCRDRAANGSPPGSFALRYDATAPSVNRFAAKAGNALAELTWTASRDTTLVEIRRSGRVVYRGTSSSFTDRGLANGTRYAYALTAYDEASNSATAGAVARPTAPLISPVAGARVSSPPRLVWAAVSKATYYHVQVWRGRRILSLWPRRTSVRLRRTWTYAGRRYRLTPGRYRWFVWPGYGKQTQKKFGPLIGSSSFVVAR